MYTEVNLRLHPLFIKFIMKLNIYLYIWKNFYYSKTNFYFKIR